MGTKKEKKFRELVNESSERKGKALLSEKDSFQLYEELNSKMREVRRDFQKKSKQSEIESANIVLTS